MHAHSPPPAGPRAERAAHARRGSPAGRAERLGRPASLALFAVALAWRWAYLVRLAHTPLAGSLNADSRIYWEWSDAILRNGPLPPAPFYLAPLYPYALAGVRAL